MEYLLSIVIPTKNRYKYLFHLIKMLRDFQSEDFELVINDNTEDNSEIIEFLSSIDFPNLKYYHVLGHLSVSQNADQAIRKSSGKYVCFIGDDDGVFPEIVQCVKEAESKGVEAIISKVVKYNWPDYVDNSRYHLSGVVLEECSTRKEGFLDVKNELKKVINNGFCTLGLLPKVYQGIVSRSLLNLIYDKCGTYFPGPSPDMANAIALSILTNKVYYFNRNLIITGQCRSVGGGERLLKGKLLNIKEVPHFSKDDVLFWDRKLPDVWCAETVWPASGIQAMRLLMVDHSIPYTKIYARFVYKHRNYINLIDNFSYNVFELHLHLILYRLYDLFNGAYCRLSFFLSRERNIKRMRLYRNITSVNKVIELCYSL